MNQIYSGPLAIKPMGFRSDTTYEELEKRVLELEQAESKRNRAEEALETRIMALTRPLDDARSIAFQDLFNLDDIQRLQDEFANATGVASIITHTDGTPITRPSNFCRLCNDIIRKSDKGLINCFKSDAMIGRLSPDGPIIQPCMSGGLWDAGAAISVGGKHIANWLIGQVRDENQTEEKIREYAREIEADEESSVEAFSEVPCMSRDRFGQIAQMLFTLANQLSTAAYQNLQQARFIADRKLAEDALRESEKRFRDLAETLPEAVFETDWGLELTFANRRAFELFGYSADELKRGLNGLELLAPEDRDRAKANMDRRLKGEDIGAVEYNALRKDGSMFPMLFHVGPIMNDGEAIGFRGIAVDITDRKCAEKERALNVQRMHVLLQLNQMTEATLQEITDFALEEAVRLTQSKIGYLAFLNDEESVLTMHSWSKSAMAKCAITDKPIMYSVETTGLWGEAVRQRRPVITNDYTISSSLKKGYPEGHVAVWRHMNIPVFVGTRIVLVAGVGNKAEEYIQDDIQQLTLLMEGMWGLIERKRADKALRESEESLKAILAASPNPMVIYDSNGAPLYINPVFTDVFGWTWNELKGHCIPFVPEDQKKTTMDGIQKIYLSGSPFVFETQRYAKDGRTLDVIVNAAVFKGPDGTPAGMVVNFTDISERKSLQAQYEQAKKMESIGTLAGGIAHDFNNLLMGIQGRASLMAFNLEPVHANFEHISAIEEYVKSASDLTKQLLGFARGGKYEVKPIEINEVVFHSATMFGRTRKQIQIHTNLNSPTPVVEANRGQIEQVLLNMYVNAWQAMPDGGELFLETKIVTLDDPYCNSHLAAPGRYVKVSVTDTGTGMDEATGRRIFDPFFSTKEKGHGTGLGLASAYGIIKNHGGMITVYSEIGHGTTFNIYLPVSDKEVYREIPMEGSVFKGSERILLVDDEEMIINVGRAMLEKLGYRVVVAKGGQQAIEALKSTGSQIDLVILDLIMPGMDGGKTFDRIQEIEPGMRVILSSGYTINGQANEILRRGCKGFIQKPFNLTDLSKIIRRVLDEAKG